MNAGHQVFHASFPPLVRLGRLLVHFNGFDGKNPPRPADAARDNVKGLGIPDC
jgi:hypothetical protein